MKKIKFSVPDILNSDLQKVNKVFKSGWLTHGKYTRLFEKNLKKFTKSKYATTVSSCTAGLHLILNALSIGKNDIVLVPAMTHVATAHAVSYTGAKVKFTDVNRETGNITLDEIKKNYTKNVKAVMIVHMAGTPVEDLVDIKKFCKIKNIFLIEDCAHALGSKINGIHVGNYGDAAAFSFYPTKQITSGEGGAIITNNKKIYEKLKMLKAFGIDTDINQRKIPGLYNVKHLGYNFRMTDFQAALLYFQLIRYKKNLLKRKKNAITYEKFLKDCKKIKFSKFSKNNSYFIFQIFVEKKNRNNLISKIIKKKIGCSIHYATPVPYFDFYKNNIKKKQKFVNAQHYSSCNISLPVHSHLKFNDIKYISNYLKDSVL